jgi:hypothetical protein
MRLLQKGREVSDQRVLFSSWDRYQHRYLLTIDAISVSVGMNQVPLFKLNGHENVRSGHHREEQMAKGHARCAPKRDDKPKIERMADHLIESR